MKKKTERKKIILDTTIQIDKFVKKEIQEFLKKLRPSADFFSLFFVLYEFKSSFITALIRFYSLVNICETPAEAIEKFSNFPYTPRQLKYKSKMDALIANLNKSTNNGNESTEDYLAQIEAAILYFINNFDTDLKGKVGSFAGNDVVKFEIKSRDDFSKFDELTKTQKIIELKSFWDKNLNNLENLIYDSNVKKEKHVKKLYEALIKIKADTNEANKFRTNKSVGDAVIAVDIPKSYLIASTDKSFGVLCPALKKEHIKP